MLLGQLLQLVIAQQPLHYLLPLLLLPLRP
jgi:hypothetical protein